ncbi:1,4-dihydroxy-2-naphthoyl-CoA synthase [Rhodococcus fascians]|uniref:enoyl-CoA hydratase/isomerase family protein n=1 Tax=Nocardiaceae TaxID=85025 RepID=UPI001427B2E6|nr:enoyl-CoA hydratase/isomerase family protein [Rhodococcus sp. 06-221-2]NIL85874.1 1,4-dihydroxy-2-naphthoyl-CoA synthase [Rhodococcus fascians]NIL91517.1 1,4-dihydroxy-2-naphthoyl-CoA synthase [Rhodococcus fascians]
MTENVTWELQGRAAVVTIRLPQVRNALGPREAALLGRTISAAAAHPDALGVVLTGQGAFCAGGDLPAIVEATEGRDAAGVSEFVYRDFQSMVRALRECPIPTVAAVDGAAIGLGLDLALWCDARFLGPKAKLAQGWATLGLIPGTGGAKVLQELLPGALWHLLGQRPINADQAATLGVGVRSDDALAAAVDLIEGWGPVGRPALEGYAALSRNHLPDDTYLQECARIQGERLTSESFAKTAQAILAR